jgi:SnoaL-like protein
MSKENIEIARHANAGLQGVDVVPLVRGTLAGDTSAVSPQLVDALTVLLGPLDPNIKIDTSDLELPGFGVLRGVEGLRELWGRWIEGWEHYSWIQSNYTEVGEHVVYDVEVQATGRSSGVEVIWNHCQAFTFRDGKIIRWSLFKDRAAAYRALETAGFSE